MKQLSGNNNFHASGKSGLLDVCVLSMVISRLSGSMAFWSSEIFSDYLRLTNVRMSCVLQKKRYDFLTDIFSF